MTGSAGPLPSLYLITKGIGRPSQGGAVAVGARRRAGRPKAEPQAPLRGGLQEDLSSSPCARETVRALRFGLRPTGATERAYRYGPASAKP